MDIGRTAHAKMSSLHSGFKARLGRRDETNDKALNSMLFQTKVRSFLAREVQEMMEGSARCSCNVTEGEAAIPRLLVQYCTVRWPLVHGVGEALRRLKHGSSMLDTALLLLLLPPR